GGPPLLAIAARYFFRRAVEDDPELFRALAFARLDRLQESQDAAFAQLADALAAQGGRLQALLADLGAVVDETHDAALDVRAEQQRQGQQLAAMYDAVLRLQQQLDLGRREVRPRDSLSVRDDRERELVKQVI